MMHHDPTNRDVILILLPDVTSPVFYSKAFIESVIMYTNNHDKMTVPQIGELLIDLEATFVQNWGIYELAAMHDRYTLDVEHHDEGIVVFSGGSMKITEELHRLGENDLDTHRVVKTITTLKSKKMMPGEFENPLETGDVRVGLKNVLYPVTDPGLENTDLLYSDI
jgi:hypothetical protein